MSTIKDYKSHENCKKHCCYTCKFFKKKLPLKDLSSVKLGVIKEPLPCRFCWLGLSLWMVPLGRRLCYHKEKKVAVSA